MLYNTAHKYHQAVVDKGQAAQLRVLTPDMRRHAMQSLAALSKFLDVYEDWQIVRRQAGLKWQGRGAVSFVHALLNQEAANAIPSLKEVLPKLPTVDRVPLVFAALSGLRPSEACKACGLVYQLNKEGKLADYYDSELSMLQHYKYPQPFLRNTKNAYISFVSSRLIEVVAATPPTTYWGVAMALKRSDLPMQFKDLRKAYATLLRKSLEREMIDLVQGRVDGSVFVKHYYRPLIKELRDRVLAATAELESELLPLTEVSAAA
jgi:integrase